MENFQFSEKEKNKMKDEKKKVNEEEEKAKKEVKNEEEIVELSEEELSDVAGGFIPIPYWSRSVSPGEAERSFSEEWGVRSEEFNLTPNS